MSSYRPIRRNVIRWQRSRGERPGSRYRGNAQQSRYRRGTEEIHEESSARYSRGGSKKNAAASREASLGKRNGLAIRMRDVPAEVSFRLGLTDRREGNRISRSVKTPPPPPLPLNCAFNCFDYRACSYRSCPSLAVTHDPPRSRYVSSTLGCKWRERSCSRNAISCLARVFQERSDVNVYAIQRKCLSKKINWYVREANRNDKRDVCWSSRGAQSQRSRLTRSK